MKNLKFTIAYNGLAYNGYQSQPCGNTVQDKVEYVLSKLMNQKVKINGCSRTDAGVHAREFVFNAVYDDTRSGIDEKGLISAMNGQLPRDIAVLGCEKVSESFHARFDAKGKEYLYLLDTSPVRNVFSEGLALHYPYSADTDKMLASAAEIKGTHNFAAFCRAEAKEHLKTTVRTVNDIKIVKNNNFLEFYISGEGFLHNMVRIIVGTLIYVNEGKRNIYDIREALKYGNREKAGKTLPPYGLYLNRVFY